MEQKANLDGVLSGYRVLDLTDEKGLLCGKMLGDVGADVVKIEKPGGDPARSIGPFYHDEPDPEKSLFWFAFNTNKRGITLDIEATDGQEIFIKLVKSADFVIESFPPGHMERLGLGYSALEKVNPRLVMVSITPFGQTGPYRDYKTADIVAWAMGGQMYPWGDADRPPIRISYHSHAYLHAGGEAALAALMALYHREITGEGQHIDVSIQETVAQIIVFVTPWWDMMKVVQRRGAAAGYDIRTTNFWPCKDGHVVWRFWSGDQSKHFNLPLVEWMAEEGMANDFIKGFDWDTFDLRAANQDVIDGLGEPTAKFFMMHTKAELYEGAMKHGLMLYPVATVRDVSESVQLADREFWAEIEHPELGTSLPYPGAYARTSEAPPRVARRAPLIGEHNQEIYDNELRISRKELSRLKQSEVI